MKIISICGFQNLINNIQEKIRCKSGGELSELNYFKIFKFFWEEKVVKILIFRFY